MKLSDLLDFNEIVIQCHDNPDADALASGYAIFWYLTKNGKDPRFIYRGKNKVTKSNLLIMKEQLNVPVSYEPDFDDIPELLITVDCQYGQKNVTQTKAKNIAIIDHHQVNDDLPLLSEVRSNIGSCSTIVWDMIVNEGMDPGEDILLSTALYYGLYTDTNKLSEVSYPLDKDMRDALVINKSIITQMCNSSISLDELKITGKAIFDYEYHGKNKYLLIRADWCDPNILGVISDFSLETVDVDICLAYYISPGEIKFSVRSCVKEVHADELAAFLAKDIGGGGGHITKAGGTLRPEKLLSQRGGEESDLENIANYEFRSRLEEYFSMYKVIYAKDTILDTSDMKLFEKEKQLLGYVELSEVFPIGTLVEIRTLEGDIDVRIEKDTYLMIGIEGEVYPIAKSKLESSYGYVPDPFEKTFEYEPNIKDVVTGEIKNVRKYAKSIVSTSNVRIYAKELKENIKLFTAWDEEKYYSGSPGDYIAVREDDPHDIYIINKKLFGQLYREV
ncbi:MAG: DHH family phosphoesterase [Lachnospiraceae bacterium]|nr:DHH family phosphoesterase [Lachnospiraceae bacterium]